MSKLTRTYIEVISHILLWTLPTYLIIRYDLMSFEYLHGRYFTFPLIISVILNMLIVYFNIFVLFPALNKKKLTPVLYSLVLIFIIILIAFLKVQIDNQFVWHYFSRRTSDHGRYVMELIVNFFFAGQSVLYCIVKEWIRNKINEQKLVEEKLSLELKYLKSQINPHFLYNTLNNLYSLALKNNDNETAVGIAKLSNIMRFMLSEVDEKMILLEREVGYLGSYIELQKLRFSEKDDVEINFRIEGDISDIRIHPFMFIVFIENAFKYGINIRKHSFIDIKFVVLNSELKFSISNSIHYKNDLPDPGIGLSNIRDRLKLIYQDKFNLEINSGDDIFNVDLVIRLT
ncbi:MAG: hypothetical protein A2X05_08310 [Bacteroidetes bacterium GWE2_41_25]|nr:MAG: hypothetical protein A2X03_00560 [Bacteroidetes bacterium GWA2_40_15]OFX93358.1 MAG: hypothetical protein A2X05_08310 [Bacteroidetes bacterium GWE2_41_25]OFX97811.1 MAG: hypothetical protein A2X06_06165 [Bacteroidetes bacterium GWC2_40_22]OFY60817.1 MAG: hypothetical protein A2X04_01655 [Bacteroidetes bacterium GWF2_41_9]HAM10279.1 hypothetical protein [Bacteroidales bacterium]